MKGSVLFGVMLLIACFSQKGKSSSTVLTFINLLSFHIPSYYQTPVLTFALSKTNA